MTPEWSLWCFYSPCVLLFCFWRISLIVCSQTPIKMFISANTAETFHNHFIVSVPFFFSFYNICSCFMDIISYLAEDNNDWIFLRFLNFLSFLWLLFLLVLASFINIWSVFLLRTEVTFGPSVPPGCTDLEGSGPHCMRSPCGRGPHAVRTLMGSYWVFSWAGQFLQRGFFQLPVPVCYWA